MTDIGYPRKPTSAMIRVEMDNDVWDVPAQLVADSRDAHYSTEKEDTIGFIRDGSLDAGALHDWASNNMDWNDVEDYAVQIPVLANSFRDRQEGWVNGKHTIIGNL